MSIDTTAKGGGYYKVFVNGHEWSKHTMAHKAGESATDVVLDAVARGIEIPVVFYTHDLEVHYVPQESVFNGGWRPTSEGGTTSDGGMDLIDFLAKVQGFEEPGPNARLINADTFYQALDVFVQESRSRKLATRLYGDPDMDGKLEWVGMAWRGYMLLWYSRKRGAITIAT